MCSPCLKQLGAAADKVAGGQRAERRGLSSGYRQGLWPRTGGGWSDGAGSVAAMPTAYSALPRHSACRKQRLRIALSVSTVRRRARSHEWPSQQRCQALTKVLN